MDFFFLTTFYALATVHPMPILRKASYFIDIVFLAKIKTKDQTLKLIIASEKFDNFLCFRNDLNDFALNLSLVLLAKGQLISKSLLGVFNSSKKRTEKFDLTTMVPLVELFLFIFWEN